MKKSSKRANCKPVGSRNDKTRKRVFFSFCLSAGYQLAVSDLCACMLDSKPTEAINSNIFDLITNRTGTDVPLKLTSPPAFHVVYSY